MTNDFFPDSDYKIPVTSNYLKLVEGENTFRVMSSAIIGYEYFTTENKPIRSRDIPEEVVNIKKGGKISHFWAFVIWNYKAERIQIMEVTQKTIQNQMKALIDNAKWGNPKKYDITISRKGTTMNDTEYTVLPNPHSDITDQMEQAYGKAKVDLDALFEGVDPFAKPQ